MPGRLNLGTTVALVSLVFSACFSLQMLGRSSSPKAAVRAAPSPLVEQPGAAPELALNAGQPVPALRDPRKPPKPKPKPKPKRRKVVAAPKPAPVRIVPTATATPAPTATAAPRPVVTPAPRYIPPARTPAPTPKASPAPSGNFDTSGAE
jgi:hypothetical protein